MITTQAADVVPGNQPLKAAFEAAQREYFSSLSGPDLAVGDDGAYLNMATQWQWDMFQSGVAAASAIDSSSLQTEIARPLEDEDKPSDHVSNFSWYTTPTGDVIIREAHGHLIKVHTRAPGADADDPEVQQEFDYAVTVAKSIVAATKRYGSELAGANKPPPVPALLFDFKSVYDEVVQQNNQSRTSQENVTDVLQAVTRIMMAGGADFAPATELLSERVNAVVDWAARTVRGAADQGYNKPIGQMWWSQLVLVAGSLAREVNP